MDTYRAVRVLGVLAVVLALSSMARADDLSRRLGLEGVVGGSIPLGSEGVMDRHDPGLGVGGGLTYGLSRRWSAHLGYDNLDFEEGPARVEAITAGLGLALAPNSAWNPTLKFGGGPAYPKYFDQVGRPTVAGATAGLSITRFLTDDFSLGASFDWVGLFEQSDLNQDVHVFRPGLTAGFWFGGQAAQQMVSLNVKPEQIALAPGQSHKFVASVYGTDNKNVLWSIAPPLGMISPEGVYTAPPDVKLSQRVNVTATSTADMTKRDNAMVQLKAPEITQKIINIQFDTGKAEVKRQYEDQLQEVAEFMREYPDAKAEIIGHTDTVGSADKNLELSEKRAEAVRQELVDKFQVEGDRLTAEGQGEENLWTDDPSPAGRARNRRVVAVFTAERPT